MKIVDGGEIPCGWIGMWIGYEIPDAYRELTKEELDAYFPQPFYFPMSEDIE